MSVNLNGKYKYMYEALSVSGKKEIEEVHKKIGFDHFFAFCDINKNFPNNTLEMYYKWKDTSDYYEKGTIRFGKDFKSKQSKIRSDARKNNPSTFAKEFWIKQGLSETDAIEKVRQIQSSNSRRAFAAGKVGNYTKEWNPYKENYWLEKGLSVEKAVEKVSLLKTKTKSGRSGYIERYGEEIGKTKYQEMLDKRKQTMLERYGVTVLGSPASKESMRFLIPLYKMLRKLGISKEDVFWKIGDRREYASYDSDRNYFFDFTIHSLKIIVEYNSLFWHPRQGTEWNGIIDRDTKLISDQKKIKHIEDRGYKVFIVWCDDDFDEKRKEITEYVNSRLGRVC